MPASRRIRLRQLVVALPALVMALTLAMVLTTETAVANTPGSFPPIKGKALAPADDVTPPPASVARPLSKARIAMANATTYRARRDYMQASNSLANLRIYLERAHKAGMAQIGAPPVDPESDDLPGPVSVIAVLAVEHLIVNQSAKLFAGLQVGIGIDATQSLTMAQRKTMLKSIVSLDPEGDGADYADGMADTLPIYAQEVTFLTSVLTTGPLSSTGRQTLQASLVQSKATNAMVNAAYGGGE
ncbi:MAG: hypothetical protein QOF68_1558 [Gaiellales bacterium]|nr:hypothetical protein [Gaiellales bacterium]